MKLYFLLTLSLILILLIFFMMTPMPSDVQTFKPRIDEGQVLIGIISDTHIPTRADKIPEEVYREFEDVDLIIHAGDFVDISVSKELERIAPVIGVEGNMDFKNIRDKYPELAIIKIYNYKIGVYHGSFLPWVLGNIARKYKLNVMISGHIHRPSIRRGDIIYINPGSATNPFLAKKSVARLKLTMESIDAEIIYLKEF